MVGMVQIMLGAAKTLLASLSNHTVQGYQTSEPNPEPPPAVLWNSGSASFRINASGTAQGVGSSGDNGTGTNATYSGEWLVAGSASDFEVRATVVSGSVSSGDSTGAWLSCSTNRAWTLITVLAGTTATVLTVEIRRSDNSTVVASSTITLQVTR